MLSSVPLEEGVMIRANLHSSRVSYIGSRLCLSLIFPCLSHYVNVQDLIG